MVGAMGSPGASRTAGVERVKAWRGKAAKKSLAVLLGCLLVRSSPLCGSSPAAGVATSRVAVERSRESRGCSLHTGTARARDPDIMSARLGDPVNMRLTRDVQQAGEARDWERAVAAFHEASKPDTILFGAAMQAARRCGCFQEGIALFERMRQEDVGMSPVIYNIAIRLLGRLRRYTEACELWEEHKRRGLPGGKALTVAYGAIMDAAGHGGHVQDALKLLEEAEASGAGDHGLFGMALSACAAAGDAGTARGLLDKIESSGRPFTAVQLSTAMAAHMAEPLSEIQKLHMRASNTSVVLNEDYFEHYIGSLLGRIEFQSNESSMWPAVLCRAGNERLEAVLGALACMRLRGCPAKTMVRNAAKAMRENSVEVIFTAGPDVADLGFAVEGVPPNTVRITDVAAGGWAAAKGWTAGDLVVAVNGRADATFSADAFRAAMQHRPLSVTVKLQ